MDQDQIVSTELSVKAPSNLDKIPEDIAESVIACIRSWAVDEGIEEERKNGRKARDSTLRAAASLSKNSYRLYFTSLLRDITINSTQLVSFQQVLEHGDGRNGGLVRSLRISPATHFSDGDRLSFQKGLISKSDLPKAAQRKDHILQGLTKTVQRCYQDLTRLETLVVQDACFIGFQFQQVINGRSSPLSFLANSIKKLCIPCVKTLRGDGSTDNISARNVIWLLLFTPVYEAILGCEMSLVDLKYISDFSHSYKGLSKVKKLSLFVEFIFENSKRRTWWGPAGMGTNRKTESVMGLLDAVDQLECLELRFNADLEPSEMFKVKISVLIELSHSTKTLKHLRLLGDLVADDSLMVSLGICMFVELKTLTIEPCWLYALNMIPSKLESLSVPFHRSVASESGEDFGFEEETLLTNWLESLSLKNVYFPSTFKEIRVPSIPFNVYGEECDSLQQRNVWAAKREKLERADIFKNGKIILRKTIAGEIVDKVTDFGSTLHALSPL